MDAQRRSKERRRPLGASARAKQRVKQPVKGARALAERRVGGPARLRVILLLASVLGLDVADKAAVSAVAGGLKDAFGINNTDIGILISVVSLVGAVATLPVGVLVDRVRRTRLLAIAIAIWAVAMGVSGTATSFIYLLIVRIFLGAVTATATPAVASLVGDFFPATERSKLYGYILAGELIGTGFGFLIAGEVSAWISWRYAFYALSLPSLIIALLVWRFLPEPARGGQGWLWPGERRAEAAEDGRASVPRPRGAEGEAGRGGAQSSAASREVGRAGIRPDNSHVLRQDPADRSLWWAARYVLSIRTNLLLIIASSLGYYFFAGARAFAMIYLTGRYDLPRSVVSPLLIIVGVGAVVGVLAGGRLADWLLHRGHVSARIIVPGGALVLMVLFMAPAIWTTNAAIGIGLMTLGAAALGAVNPPLDSARLDIMHPRLWGRAESVRITLRMLLEAAAPTIFGFISVRAFGGGTEGLKWTFLLMLIPLLIASALSIWARRTYPVDVATAMASLEATRASGGGRWAGGRRHRR